MNATSTVEQFARATAAGGPGWWQWGACRGMDPDIFFPDQGGDSKTPKEICHACTVEMECLDYALENRERFGIWGGQSERQRRSTRAARYRSARRGPPESPQPAALPLSTRA
ncbi:MAG: WhiB family transcriptional regulator [Actinomycetota bacterium]|nr:WhiB family transcriptional regulator [Actinomycetota bacterium]